MNHRALTTLEFDKIRSLGASYAVSELGKAETELQEMLDSLDFE